MKSVCEFAELKGISRGRVYALVRANQIPFRRVGQSILIDDAALGWSPQSSRSLSAPMAVALAQFMEGDSNDELRPSERNRIKDYAQRIFRSDDPSELLRVYLAKRAELFSFSIAADDLRDFRNDSRLNLSGVSAAISHMSAPNVVEAYVSPSDLPGLVREYLLREAADGNVVLRVPVLDAPVGPVYVAADLADWNRPREKRQAREILRELNRAREHNARD